MQARRVVTRLFFAVVLALAMAGPVYAQPPAAPVLGLASGDVLGSDLTFYWSPVSTATWYHLLVQDTTGVRLNAWYTTAQSQCGAGESGCYVTANVTLAAGIVYWWVQAYGPGGYSPWSIRSGFKAGGVLHVSNTFASTFVGLGAGQASPTGVGNTGVGAAALGVATTGFWNTALGASALAAVTTGRRNTAIGYQALRDNNADGNTAVGNFALAQNETGLANVAVGDGTLSVNVSGGENTAVGRSALPANVEGHQNTAIGGAALLMGTSTYRNTAVGYHALSANVAGTLNTAVGALALRHNTATNNIALGYLAGETSTTGSNNIFIGSAAGAAAEANTIRIGTTQTATYVAGISGQTSAMGVPVLVNGSGKLGITTSSQRFKVDVRDIGDASAALSSLRPVAFRYAAALDPDRVVQYGLIAEEVAQVWPELVVRDAQGRPETVRYHLLVPLLLNELQRTDASLRAVADAQAKEIAQLRNRLAALEAAHAAADRPR